MSKAPGQPRASARLVAKRSPPSGHGNRKVTSTHDWLYTQGVDLLLHKEQLCQRFGISREATPTTRRFVAVATATAARNRSPSPSQKHSSANDSWSRLKLSQTTLATTSIQPRPRNSLGGDSKANRAGVPSLASSSSSSSSSCSPLSRAAFSMPRAATNSKGNESRASSSRKRSLHKTATARTASRNSMKPNASAPTLLMMDNGAAGRSPGASANDNSSRPAPLQSLSPASMRVSTMNKPFSAAVSRRTSCSVLLDVKSMTSAVLGSPFRDGSIANNQTSADGGDPPRRRDSKVERLTEQVNVLKTSLGLSDDDLQWKVESSKGNAFLAADKHLTEAEERYERLAYETMLLAKTPCEEASDGIMKRLQELVRQNQETAELKRRMASCQTEVTRLKKLLMDARISTELQIAKTRGDSFDAVTDETTQMSEQVEAAKAQLLETQEQLKALMNKIHDALMTLANQTEALTKRCSEYKFLSLETQMLSQNILQILRRIPETATSSNEKLAQVCEETAASIRKLTGSRAKLLQKKESELAKAGKDIEVWKSRRDQSKEFAVEMAKQEKAWKDATEPENLRCLRVMRSLIPHDIQLISVETIIERAKAQGVLFTYDLAHYLKQNKLLHWLVTHESDIVRENFLAVESAPFFSNFVSYDITESRALVQILPASFDFDKDNKKREWRSQFLEYVRAMVRQQSGEKIRAGWDPVRNTRGEVALKPLSEKQLLNPLFRYPTDEEIAARLEKYELQQKRITQRKTKLQKLSEEEIPEAKSEYLALADDARSDELQKLFGKTTLIKMRDDAKANYQAKCKERDFLKAEVARAEKLANSLSPTYEQFLEEVEAIRRLEKTVRHSRIRGPFPEEIELKPKQRATFKKLSVEEEAQARKKELDNAIAERERETVANEAAAAAAAAGAGSSDATGQVPGGAKDDQGKPVRSDSNASIQTWLAPGDHELSGSPAVDGNGAASKAPEQPKSLEENDGNNKAFRRIKSLKVSLDVLRFLEKDFCVQRKKSSSSDALNSDKRPPSRGNSTHHGVNGVNGVNGIDVADDSSSASTETSKTSEALRPKSRALMRMLEKTNEAALSESGGEPSASDVSGAGGGGNTGSAPAAPRLNFLQELQSRSRAVSVPSERDGHAPVKGTPASGLSFLDELKAKRRSEHLDDASLLAKPAPLKRANTEPVMIVTKEDDQVLSDVKAELKTTTDNKDSVVDTTVPVIKVQQSDGETRPSCPISMRNKLPFNPGPGGGGGFLAELKARARVIS